jgi:hypothetical protein
MTHDALRQMLGRVIERGLAADKRLVKLFITVSDRPGGLAKLTGLIAGCGASIWDISHERAWLHQSVDQVCAAMACHALACMTATAKEEAQNMKTSSHVLWILPCQKLANACMYACA